jgi:hypothetical protein
MLERKIEQIVEGRNALIAFTQAEICHDALQNKTAAVNSGGGD